MSVQNKLLPASFRGVNFLVSSDSVELGRKLSVKEYPLSNTRFAEDLGALPPTYTIDAIVNGNEDTYLFKLNALIDVLNQSGSGQFVHPLYGANTVSVSSYTIANSQKTIGKSNFRITFIQASSNVQPVAGSNISGAINNQSDVVFQTIKSDFISNYNVSTEYKNNYSSAKNKLDAIYDIFNSSTSKFVNNKGFINNFYSKLEKFKSDIPSLVRNPEGIADSITELFNDSNNLGETATQRFDLSKSFYEFGNDDTPITIPTAEINERNNNSLALNQFMQIGGLTQSYRNIPQINYVTDEQLEIDRAVVVDQFNNTNANLNIYSDTLFQTENNRDLITEFFRQEETNVFNISEIDIKTIPLTKLTYLLYEGLMNYDQLLALNNVNDPSFISGLFKVLTK